MDRPLLGSLFATLALASLVGGAFVEPVDEPVGPEQPLGWIDHVGLALLAAGALGFVLAWWRPLEGGVLAIVGVVYPTALSLAMGAFPLPTLVWMLVGALHVLDALWRRRGVGPRVRPLWPRREAA